MFLSTSLIHPFENRTSGYQRSLFPVKLEKDMKRPSHAKCAESRYSAKKPEFSIKDPIKTLKSLQGASFSFSLEYVSKNFQTISKDQIFQVFLELADSAKRENNLEAARQVLDISIKIQPLTHQTWLEYSKLEEECGNLDSAFKILALGIQFSPLSEQIFVKLLKVEERLMSLSISRRILASFNKGNLEKYWKILLEGAIMEARAGNIRLSRHIIYSLISQCGHFGGLYLESIKFEEKWGKNLDLAYQTCEKGLEKIPRYGPLWFSALKITEKLLKTRPSAELQRKQEKILKESETYLSKELLWKLYLDFSIILSERSDLCQAKHYLKQSLLSAPENLRWKAWIFAARLEVKFQNFEKALKILKICESEVPAKQKPLVLIELSQLFEIYGLKEQAIFFMDQALEKSGSDWKVCLEKIAMESRLDCWEGAIKTVYEAISLNSSTGRLWASLIQISHVRNNGSQMKAFIKAINEVPKSGEVWCEGARIRLNPFSPYFDLLKAEKYLSYAVQFTPQYGDSFIEMIRVFVLKGELHRLKELKRMCINADPNYGTLWFYCKQHPLDGSREVFKRAKLLVINDLCKTRTLYELGVRSEYQGVRGEYQGVRSECQGVRSEYQGVRNECQGVRSECQGVRNEYQGVMWMGLMDAVYMYLRFGVLDLNSRTKMIYGSEGLVF